MYIAVIYGMHCFKR